MNIILASQSSSRQSLLRNAGVPFQAVPARIDEETVITSMQAEGEKPRDIADALAEAKAAKIAGKYPDDLVIGSDQILHLDGKIFQKPETKDQLKAHLRDLSGKTHELLTSVVIYKEGRPVWRIVVPARLSMMPMSEAFLDAYTERNWDEVRHCVGGYMLEKEGVQLLSKVEGDYFTILGLPLIEVVGYLKTIGVLQS